MAAQRDRLVGNWQHFHARLDRLRENVTSDLEQFHTVIEELTTLREDVEEAYKSASRCSNIDTAVASFRRVQATADLPSDENCREGLQPTQSVSHSPSALQSSSRPTSGRRWERHKQDHELIGGRARYRPRRSAVYHSTSCEPPALPFSSTFPRYLTAGQRCGRQDTDSASRPQSTRRYGTRQKAILGQTPRSRHLPSPCSERTMGKLPTPARTSEHLCSEAEAGSCV